nr:efflux pump patc [Quercus suber]
MVPPNRIADATAFVGFGQIGGSAIMLSIANAVFLNTATNGINSLLPDTPMSQVQAAIAAAGSQLFDSLSDALRRSVLEIIVNSINDAYILIIVAGALTAVTSVFIERKRSQ